MFWLQHKQNLVGTQAKAAQDIIKIEPDIKIEFIEPT